jgi:serine/threonine protein kinase
MTNERFQILGEIGRGSRSVVYRARDVLLDREVALKVYARSSHTAPIREHFLGEARALASVEHPHVVSLWGIEERDDELRIALALVEGEPLTAAKRPLPARRIAEIGRDLCSALGSLHARGLLHRDLRPENVMLRPDGSAVLLDFGVERSLPNPEAVTDFDEFDAPELRAGDAFTQATDVYALARLMEWLGRGRLPEPLLGVVSRATREDIAERTPDPETLSIELAPCLDAETRRPYRLFAAVAALVAVVALGATQWRSGDDPVPRAESSSDEDAAWLVRGEGFQIRFADLVRAMPWRATFEGRVPQPLPDDAVVLRVPEEFATVQEAYDACADGAFIVLGPGDHGVRPLLADQAKTVTLVGLEGAARTALLALPSDLEPSPVVLTNTPGATVFVRGLTLAMGNGYKLFNKDNGRYVKAGGGVIAQKESRIVLEDCIVCCNGLDGSAFGGALATFSGGALELRDCLVVANYATLNSCIACIDDGTMVAERCTFTRNAASGDNVSMGGFTVLREGSIRLDQCIVWDNAAWTDIGRDYTTPEIQASGLGEIVIERSITYQPYPGAGNRSVDPRFRNPDRGDFRLQPGVPWNDRGCFRE